MTDRSVCPLDLEPCRSGCHDSEMCSRWGSYMIPTNPHQPVKYDFDIQPVLYSDGPDLQAQQKIEGYA